MLSILLCGEGATDCGALDYGTHIWTDGPVQEYNKKICEANDIEFLIETVHKNDVREFRVIGRQQNIDGHANKAYKLAAMAMDRGLNTAICYIDEDNNGFQEIYQDIREGFELRRNVSGIPAVPQRMIESWLLADAGAYERIYHREPDDPPLPRRPELIWGAKADHRSNYPKNVMVMVLEQFHAEPSRDVFVSIAMDSSIDVLRRRCPNSFARFMDDIIKANERINQ